MHYEQDSDYQRADTSVIIDPYSDYQYINEVCSDVFPSFRHLQFVTSFLNKKDFRYSEVLSSERETRTLNLPGMNRTL